MNINLTSDIEHAQTDISARPGVLLTESRLVAESLQLLFRLDRDLRDARAQWNYDWFRRVMRIRARAVRRVKRRCQKLPTVPTIALGGLARRYHSNLAKYLRQDLH